MEWLQYYKNIARADKGQDGLDVAPGAKLDRQASARSYPATKHLLFSIHAEFRKMWTYILDITPDHAWPTNELKGNPLRMHIAPRWCPAPSQTPRTTRNRWTEQWREYTLPEWLYSQHDVTGLTRSCRSSRHATFTVMFQIQPPLRVAVWLS